MDHADYDKALYYTHRSQWDNLLILMVRTKDDLLSKRIEHFLHAYHFEYDHAEITPQAGTAHINNQSLGSRQREGFVLHRPTQVQNQTRGLAGAP